MFSIKCLRHFDVRIDQMLLVVLLICDYNRYVVFAKVNSIVEGTNGIDELNCPTGFEIRNGKCEDVDECQLILHHCTQNCVNSAGSYHCECESGYRLASDGLSCADVNECLPRNGHGPCQDLCTNTAGSYQCSCANVPGTRLAHDGHGCLDAENECASAGCSHTCVNTHGTTFCTCPDGMELGGDWKMCHESNEENDKYGDIDDAVEEDEEDEQQEGEEDDDYEEEYEDENNNSDKHSRQGLVHSETKQEEVESSPSEKEDNFSTDRPDLESSNIDNTEMNKEASETDNMIYKSSIEKPDNLNHHITNETLDQIAETKNYFNKESDNSQDFQGLNNNDKIEETKIIPESNHIEKETDGYTSYNAHNVNTNLSFNNEDNKVSQANHALESENKDEDDFGDTDENNDNENDNSDNSIKETAVTDINTKKSIKEEEIDITTEIYDENIDGKNADNKVVQGASIEHTTTDIISEKEETESTEEDSEENDNDEYEDEYEDSEEDYQQRNDTRNDKIDDDKESETDKTKTELKIDENTTRQEVIPIINVTEINISAINESGSLNVNLPKDLTEITDNNVYFSGENNKQNTEFVESSETTQIPENKTNLDKEDNSNITDTKNTNSGAEVDEKEEEYEDEYEDVYEEEDNDERNKYNNTILKTDNNSEIHITKEDEADKKEVLEEDKEGDDYESNNHNNTIIKTEENNEVHNKIIKENQVNENEDNEVEGKEDEEYYDESDYTSTVKPIITTVKTCSFGFQTTEYGECVDIDECTQRNDCSDICINTEGSYKCDCPEGHYIKEGNTTCVQIFCTHGYDYNKIQNILKCVCPYDHYLGIDQITCIHNSHCDRNHNCSHGCKNRNECFCDDGYILSSDGISCQNIKDLCHGGFNYDGESNSCLDIDECADENANDCAQMCVNIVGSYECDCNIGFELDENEISCRDIDECTESNHDCEHTCRNNIGSYSCDCNDGFELSVDNKHCQELNLCLDNNGDCSHSCVSVQGKIHCSCPEDYELEDKACVKRNPCEINNGGCSHVCEVVDSFVRCNCPETYQLHNDTHCDKINPCFEFNNGCSHICETVNDTAICKCPDDTYELIDKTCYKINPCAFNNGGCSHTCIFLDDRVECSCPDNYDLDGNRQTCYKRNPCLVDNGNCSHECIFQDDVKKCLCPNGLQLQDEFKCVWTDACLVSNGGCSHVCESLEGQVICKCPSRFELVNKTCIRINPCLINNGGCSHKCHNVFRGRVKCSCPPNHLLHGKICLENDLCQRNNGGCSHLCQQNNGLKHCACPHGFILRPDGRTCKELNECKMGNGGCSHGCVNTIGSYNCTCSKGLQLDDSRRTCLDIDECQIPDTCEQTCTNYHGGFRCGCRQGFVLGKDGHRCQATGFSECPSFAMDSEGAHMSCLGLNMADRKYVPVGTRCVVWCAIGYKLDGDTLQFCENTGNWSSRVVPSCIRVSCPKVPNPDHGRLLPSTCTSAKTFAGDKCRIYCKRGARNAPNMEYIQCQAPNLLWMTLGATRSTVSMDQVQRACVIEQPKPFIMCPGQGRLSLELAPGQSEMLVVIPRPKSNVDWGRYVHSDPPWAKSLTTTLPPGRVAVRFTAYSPVTNDTSASCQLLITVKDVEPPTLTGCPSDVVVQLRPGEQVQNVYWRHPEAHDNIAVRTLYRSREPGSVFGIGTHYVNYVASDDEGNRGYCHFNVIVKGNENAHSARYRAVLVCPDGVHAADTADTIDNSVAGRDDCHWKHVRIRPTIYPQLTTSKPANYFQRQYPDPYQLSHGNYFSPNRSPLPNNHHSNRYTPFSWYNRCC